MCVLRSVLLAVDLLDESRSAGVVRNRERSRLQREAGGPGEQLPDTLDCCAAVAGQRVRACAALPAFCGVEKAG